MHILKGDLLTLHSNVSVASVLAQIDLIQVKHAPETLVEQWSALLVDINGIIDSLHRSFRIPPKKTFCIAIDDSKIQRKLLRRFFEYMSVPAEHITIIGENAKEIKDFESFAISYMHTHKDDYVLMNVDENLDVLDG